jgi:diguanylate cyclase (GGDEF)-like protein
VNPVGYLLVSMCFTSAALALVFWIAWRSFGREVHALTWSVTFAIVTIQRIANLSSEAFPSRDVYWVVVNAIGVAAVTLALIGHLQRVGRPTRVGVLVGLAVLDQLAVAWYTFGQPHVGLRMALQPIHAGVLLCIVAWIIYRHRQWPSAAEKGAALAHLAFGLGQGSAGVVALLQGPAGDQRLLDLYLQINFLIMPGAFAAMGMFVVLILASDMAERMRQLAVTDPLTGLFNRRGFREAAERTLSQARRAGRPLSLVLGDIDRFKSINDTWGHAVGDVGIVTFAAEMRRSRRAGDVVARIGGEEMVVLLADTPRAEAAEVAERIRLAVRERGLDAGERRIPMSASFGVTSLRPGIESLDDLLREADDALYRAKEGGRDRVVCAGEISTPLDLATAPA